MLLLKQKTTIMVQMNDNDNELVPGPKFEVSGNKKYKVEAI